MQFDLDINQAAQIEIVMDPASGSSLKGRGAGNLLMKSTPMGSLICGEITCYQRYNFKIWD